MTPLQVSEYTASLHLLPAHVCQSLSYFLHVLLPGFKFPQTGKQSFCLGFSLGEVGGGALLPIDGHSTGVQLEGLPSKTSAQVRLGLLSSTKKLRTNTGMRQNWSLLRKRFSMDLGTGGGSRRLWVGWIKDKDSCIHSRQRWV